MLARSPATGKMGNPPHNPVAGDRANSDSRTVLGFIDGRFAGEIWSAAAKKSIHPTTRKIITYSCCADGRGALRLPGE